MGIHRMDPAINYNEVDIDKEDDIYIGNRIIISTMYSKSKKFGFRVYSIRNNKRIGVSLVDFENPDYLALYDYHYYLNFREIDELYWALWRNNNEVWRKLISKTNDFILNNYIKSRRLINEISPIPNYAELPTRNLMFKYKKLLRKSKILNEVGEICNLYYGNKIEIFFRISKPDFILKVFKRKVGNYPSRGCRISALEPKYIDCEFKNDLLTKDELKEFIDILNSRRTCVSSRYPNLGTYPFTVWEQFIEDYNNALDDYGDETYVPILKDTPMPDYSKLPTSD